MQKGKTIAVILGGGINEDGTLPSWVHQRVDKAYELLSSGRADYSHD